MKITQFIEKYKGKKPKKTRWCASVMQNSEGDFYSYGYHYPLLFKALGKWWLNTSGYSHTTASHIHWARENGKPDYEIKLRQAIMSLPYRELEHNKREILMDSAKDERRDLLVDIERRRKGSQKYEADKKRLFELSSIIYFLQDKQTILCYV